MILSNHTIAISGWVASATTMAPAAGGTPNAASGRRGELQELVRAFRSGIDPCLNQLTEDLL
jgi:hypothetical protein